ncbi:LamG-like jellyroll fold domain-containing protein [Phaeocystidibacter luteus]|uniref:T9SS type A sorting domain-containing protein n=1 Tax=Phaeocystidibacter luteus TaxID=911197 RepID=A0A6N6RLJ9_9FLAO|nr:LamG-like jellyroll fold domain-containing protein [Phaeocystidibacter luteus]KAB2814440.1 T9SS type A sorting domain-containing protein [Phaeocystidibacter luteus]
MKHLSTLLMSACIAASSAAFGQNAFNFDGVDDYATAANASGFVAGSPAISLSMWVYPTASAPTQHGGMAGFRNETSDDFFILQLQGTTNIEARFRNSSGTHFTITYTSGINVNAWNHYVLTYNGSQLKLYHDGSLVSTVSASGTLASSTTPFGIGRTPFGGGGFHFQGDMDDVGLWDKSLTAAEVTALYNGCGYDVTDQNLQLCYEFNQGTAGGNNGSITSFIDSKGNANANILSGALSGATSNFVTGVPSYSYSNISETLCESYTSPTGMIYDSTGTYFDTIPKANGCDSIIEINLTINRPDTSVTVSGDTLYANESGSQVTYQWFDCDSGFELIGQTAPFYYPSANGTYSVIVTKKGCEDTSGCHTVFVNDIGIAEDFATGIDMYPNPAKHSVTVTSESDPINKVEILDLTGQLVHSLHDMEETSVRLNVSELSSGVYLIKVYNSSKELKVSRLVIE